MAEQRTAFAQAEYNGRRLRYLIYSAVPINAYYFLFLACVAAQENFIFRDEKLQHPPGVVAPAVIQLVIILILFFVSSACMVQVNNISAKWSLRLLALATVFFILSIFVPTLWWGGSHKSIFGGLLAAVSGLTVIVAKGPKMRIGFAAFCCVAFFVAVFVKIDVFPNTANVFNFSLPVSIFGFRTVGFSGDTEYAIFQTFATLGAITIAIWLSIKDAVDKGLFGYDVSPAKLIDRPLSRQQRSDLLQSSIKLAVDIERQAVAAGGQSFSDCVAQLVGSDPKNVWYAEWTLVTGNIISESLHSAHENPSITAELAESQVNEIVNNYFAPKRPH